MTDMFGRTDDQVAADERRFAENDEISAAIRKIRQRRERDAHLLELLNLNSVLGFAHEGAVAAARAINGEAS